MKVILTTLNSKYIHSSLSIRYLKSFSEDIIDTNIVEYTINQNNDYIAGDLYNKNPDLIAFSCYIWNIENILEICERLKIVNSNIKILLGGPEVSYDGEDILKQNNFIDYIAYGEGEETFKELLISLLNNDDLDKINGLIYRNNNEIIKTDIRKPINNLDLIKSPYVGDLKEYENKIIYYESSRGCPFNCKFCLSSTFKGIRFFSIERVKSDLKKLINAKVKQVKFVDRTFNADKKYAMEIMQFIIDQNVTDTNFHFEVTAHLLDDEMLEFLSKAPIGLFQFEIGVQSTNNKVLKEINRITDFDRLSRVVRKIKSFNNIHQHLDLIAGLPYEDYNSFKKSFDDVYNLEPDKLQLGFLKLLKGSDIRLKLKEYGYKFIDKPPYEILENNYISYSEMLKLKAIEELVEKYGNEKDFKESISFIIKNYYNSPFEFYEAFSKYWEIKEYDKISHSKKSLYKILYEFYIHNIGERIDIFNELIKFDYIYNNISRIPEFIKRIDTECLLKSRHDFLKQNENLSKYLKRFIDESPKKIINEVHFEKFKFNILKLKENDYNCENLLDFNETILLFDYNKSKLLIDKCNVFNVTKEFNVLEE